MEGLPKITATEHMPQKPTYTISNLNYDLNNEEDGELCSFNLSIQDIINQKNYYRLIIRARKTFDNTSKSCIYEVSDPSFLIPINRYNSSNSFFKGKNGYFTDELFEGEEKNFYVTVNKPEGIFDHLTIEVISYSEKLYNFNLTRKEQKRDSNNMLFNSEAVFIDSNIEGGYGIFGGRSRSRRAYGPTYPDNGVEY